MPHDARLNDAAPGFSVRDLDAAVRFYEEALGLSEAFRNESYAVMKRDAVSIHLSLDPSGDRGGKGFCTVFVSGVDKVYETCRARGAKITRPIENSPYGLRDFVIADLDGNTLLIGERISA